MKILTKPITRQLKANLLRNLTDGEAAISTKPVVKLFGGACTWLLSELDDDGIAFGLCDLGMGSPELGYVSVDELLTLRFRPFGLPIERDMSWRPKKTLVEYADEARRHGRVVA